MDTKILQLQQLLIESTHAVAFTGAGISVESGIPPFRGKNGLWEKYDMELLHINHFFEQPKSAWEFITKIFIESFNNAQPNAAHYCLQKLEKRQILKAIVTQNIDNLHQQAGSTNVIEFHGNVYNTVCLGCGRKFNIMDLLGVERNNVSALYEKIPDVEFPLLCPDCSKILKPDIVFFGESIPEEPGFLALSEMQLADLVILIGTTGVIVPASGLPYIAKEKGAIIVEINPEPSEYTKSVDLYIPAKAGEFCQIFSETTNL